MTRTLDMQFIRYLNLFEKITRVNATHCFAYNNMIVFAIPRFAIKKALGRDNINLQKISQIIKKRIRIVAQPIDKGPEQIEHFVKTIVQPVEYNSFEVKNNEVTIAAGREGKARLIGRQRIRQKELQDILEQYFGIKKVNIA